MRKFISLILLVWVVNSARSQTRVMETTLFLSHESGILHAGMNMEKGVSSVVLDFPSGFLSNHGGTVLCYYKDSGFVSVIEIVKDPHADVGGVDRSALIFLPGDCYRIELNMVAGIQQLPLPVKLISLFVPKFSATFSRPIQNRASCDSPSWIPQSIWRTGLPDPVKGRVSTPTSHCIIHHSASGNGDTNYTDLVRNYYTFHTTVNGWDDIGYNFLIAANGDIYAGRDPEKSGIRQDNVLGAHFCGKNSNTMGVCLIGNFEKSTPTTQSLNSLRTLLGWKIHLDSLDPYGKQSHPGIVDPLLTVVAGHRDGCATECPGDSLYSMITDIKNGIYPCSKINAVQWVKSENFRVKTLQNGWEITNLPVGMSIQLADLQGKLIFKGRIDSSGTILIETGNSGIFILKIGESNGYYRVLKLGKQN